MHTILPLPTSPAFEDLFETSFQGLRIIVSNEPRQFNAAAFALGNDIYMRPEYWLSESSVTTGLLAHELAHVIQFRQGRICGSDKVLNDDALEYEAELAALAACSLVPKSQIAKLTGSKAVPLYKGTHVLCRPDWIGDTWFKNKTRPGWAGKVRIRFERIVTPKDTVVRPIQVTGIIAPGPTKGRGNAPEPVSGTRVSTAASNILLHQRYNAQTGANARNTGYVDAHKGHIMALELGGPDIPENIVPQFANWQANGEWRHMERELEEKARKLLKTGQYLEFDCVVEYKEYKEPRHASKQSLGFPAGFRVVATILDRLQQNRTHYRTFSFNQRQNETDDMMAYRAMDKVEAEASKTAIPPVTYGVGNKTFLDATVERNSLDLLRS